MSDNFGNFDEHEGEVPAAPSSGLAGLRAMREDITKPRRLDIPVETSEGEFFVRFAPVPSALITKLGNEAEKRQKNADIQAEVNAQTLVTACRGIFARNVAGEEWEWEGFNLQFATEFLGQPELRDARKMCRALYGHGDEGDGIIAGVVRSLMRWSGYVEEAMVEEHEGN